MSLYRGWASTAMRDVPGSAGYFVMYELLTRKFIGEGRKTAGKEGTTSTIIIFC